MKRLSLTQSMTLLHTWGGLVLGWLLFIIFLTGSLAVFDQEIDDWMRPEMTVQQVSQMDAAQRAVAYLKKLKPDAENWRINLPTERSSALSVIVNQQRQRGGNREIQYLDPRTGDPITVRKTGGGMFFFAFHFLLNLPTQVGIWLTGIAAMSMLAALISGVIIHKKIFKEFFTFRPRKGQRSWLDAHNVTGVLMLPFHLMITYTALTIFAVTYMPAGVHSMFGGDQKAYYQALSDGSARSSESKEERVASPRAQMTALAPVFGQARQTMGEIDSFSVINPGRSDARIEVRASLGNHIELTKGESMTFDGVNGQVLKGPSTTSRASLHTQRVMAGLHFAQFGGYPMRWLYFVCGLASCAMIATGLVLFTVKRRRTIAKENAGVAVIYHAAECLNVAVVTGLILACTAYLWANHLIPADLAERDIWEVRAFFFVWMTALGHAIARPWASAWREQMGVAAAACLLLPALNLLSGHDHHIWLESTALITGVLLIFAARKLGTGQTSKSSSQPRVFAKGKV